MPFNQFTGTLRRPYRGIGKSAFDVTLNLNDFDRVLQDSVNVILSRSIGGGGGGGGGNTGYARGFVAGTAAGVAAAPQLPRGTILDQFGNPLNLPESPGGNQQNRRGTNTRFSAYSAG